MDVPQAVEKFAVFNHSKKRIAAGCGLDVVDVNRLLKQFEGMQQIIKQVTGGRKPGIGGFMHGRGLRKRKKK